MINMIMAAILSSAASLAPTSEPVLVERIDPPYWWAGMKNDTLQLMVSGKDVASAQVKAEYPGVELIKDVRLDSPNYKFLYFKLSNNMTHGEMPLTFTIDGREETLNYEFRARCKKGEEHQGFDARDVLYLLMPDRFAQGKSSNEDPYAGLEFKA